MSKSIIFISYHKKAQLLSGSYFQPLHVGRALNNEDSKREVTDPNLSWLKQGAIGDDTGDNISIKNQEFCEMTGIYWIWKNLDKFEEFSHIGHMQYRRHFILNENFFTTHPTDLEKIAYGCMHLKRETNQRYLNDLGWSEDTLKKYLDKYVGILPVEGDFSSLGLSNLWEDYLQRIQGVHVDDLLTLLSVLHSEFPNFAQKFENYLEGKKKLMYQMFLLRREDFIDYCEFIFPILFKVEKLIDVEKYSSNGKRTLGYLAELLYGCYFNELKKKKVFFEAGISFLDNA